MTARAGLYTFIATVIALIPATVVMALDVPFGFLWLILPLVSIIISPVVFSRWIPRRQVRKWLEAHDIECDEHSEKLLLHLAAHSGLPYTSPAVLFEEFGRAAFYVSRENVAEILYLQQPEFEDEAFRAVVRRLTNRPPVELVRAALDAGATPEGILHRHGRGAPMTAVLESFVEGLPEEYFMAMVGGED